MARDMFNFFESVLNSNSVDRSFQRFLNLGANTPDPIDSLIQALHGDGTSSQQRAARPSNVSERVQVRQQPGSYSVLREQNLSTEDCFLKSLSVASVHHREPTSSNSTQQDLGIDLLKALGLHDAISSGTTRRNTREQMDQASAPEDSEVDLLKALGLHEFISSSTARRNTREQMNEAAASERTSPKTFDSHNESKKCSSSTDDNLEKCVICQNEFSEEDDLFQLECLHLFHKSCIQQWFKRENTCPICRTIM